MAAGLEGEGALYACLPPSSLVCRGSAVHLALSLVLFSHMGEVRTGVQGEIAHPVSGIEMSKGQKKGWIQLL